MTGTFQYTVLKYRHSFITGEVLNIGILFLLDNGRIEFRYPSRLGRISSLYAKFPLPFIKGTLTSFKSTAHRLSRNPLSNSLYSNNLESLISDHFLTLSSGALFFGDIKQAVSVSDSESMVQHYYDLYLGDYEVETHENRNERYILDKVKSIIKNKFSPSIEAKLRINKTINDPHGNFKESFEYGWQNGKLNLITPIALDLEKEQSLEAKALRWSGILNFLKEPAEKDNLNFDILLTEPSNLNLRKSFNRAVDIIAKSNAPITFVEETSYNKYLDHAVEVVLEHEADL